MENCSNIEKCPIYKNLLNEDETLISTYKRLYCEAGEKNIKKCKRYQVAEVLGSCPPNILPNSTRTVEEISDIGKNLELSKK